MDYAALKSGTIEPLIRKYGKAVSLRRPIGTTGWTKAWNAEQGRYQWTMVASPFTVVYVDPAAAANDLAGYAIEKKYSFKEINGTTVLASDRRFITADLPTPTMSDKLIVNSVVLNIITAIPVQPGTVTLVWELQCRV